MSGFEVTYSWPSKLAGTGTQTLLREIKRLRSEVNLVTKRYHGAKQDMVTRLQARLPPPVPARPPQGGNEAEEPEVRWLDVRKRGRIICRRGRSIGQIGSPLPMMHGWEEVTRE